MISITDQSQFDAWHDILEEWKKVRRMKKLVQELYEQVGGTLFYLLDYARKNDISLPNKDALYSMADRIHYLMDQIEPPKKSDDTIQRGKNEVSDDNGPVPVRRYCNVLVGSFAIISLFSFVR